MLIEKKKKYFYAEINKSDKKKVGKNFTNSFPNKKELLKITTLDLDFFLHRVRKSEPVS